MPERRGKGSGPIRTRCRRGSGGSISTTLAEAVNAILGAERSNHKAGRGKIGGINVPVSDDVDGDRGPVSRTRTC
jgi:hypothetical protein